MTGRISRSAGRVFDSKCRVALRLESGVSPKPEARSDNDVADLNAQVRTGERQSGKRRPALSHLLDQKPARLRRYSSRPARERGQSKLPKNDNRNCGEPQRQVIAHSQPPCCSTDIFQRHYIIGAYYAIRKNDLSVESGAEDLEPPSPY